MSDGTTFIRVMGMPRSGNHPIIKLIEQNAGPGGWIHYNYCRPGQDPTQAATLETKDGVLKIGAESNRDQIEALKPLEEFDVVLFSYEGLHLNAHHGLENRISEPFEDRIDYNLFITRSPQNWLASWMQQRLRKLAKNPDADFNLDKNPIFVVMKCLNTFQNWTAHLHAVDAAIDAQGQSMTGGARNVGAVYDQFYADAAHRRQIITQLGMEPTNLEMPSLTTYGAGSSFSGLKIKDAAELKVEDRWRHFAANPYFAMMLQIIWLDDEMRALCAKHFPRASASLDAYLNGAADAA